MLETSSTKKVKAGKDSCFLNRIQQITHKKPHYKLLDSDIMFVDKFECDINSSKRGVRGHFNQLWVNKMVALKGCFNCVLQKYTILSGGNSLTKYYVDNENDAAKVDNVIAGERCKHTHTILQ